MGSITLWYIWSIEHGAWWKPGHAGYTTNKKEAGVYPEVEALQIVANANEHRSPDQPPNEAMVRASKVTVEPVHFSGHSKPNQIVEDPLNAGFETCKECESQVTFIGVQESIESFNDVEHYSCRCGHLQYDRPVVENKK